MSSVSLALSTSVHGNLFSIWRPFLAYKIGLIDYCMKRSLDRAMLINNLVKDSDSDCISGTYTACFLTLINCVSAIGTYVVSIHVIN